MFYEAGQHQALEDFDLIKVGKILPLLVRRRKDPYAEIYRRLARAFKLKMPKFDLGALLKRQLNNPLKQPRLHLSGKSPPLRL